MTNEAKTRKPEVGDGATESVGSDCYPYTVVKVSESGKTIWLQRDSFRRADSNGPFTESQSYVYERCPEAPLRKATLRKDGRYRMAGQSSSGSMRGCTVSVGHRRAYMDPHF